MPVGTRLPPGVHAVAAVPATAVVAPVRSGSRAVHLLPRAAVPGVLAVAAVAPGGSGSRGAHLLPRAAVPESGEPAAEADDGEACLKVCFKMFLSSISWCVGLGFLSRVSGSIDLHGSCLFLTVFPILSGGFRLSRFHHHPGIRWPVGGG